MPYGILSWYDTTTKHGIIIFWIYQLIGLSIWPTDNAKICLYKCDTEFYSNVILWLLSFWCLQHSAPSRNHHSQP